MKIKLVLMYRNNSFFDNRSENQKKTKRSECGVTEQGGAFDILKSFHGNK